MGLNHIPRCSVHMHMCFPFPSSCLFFFFFFLFVPCCLGFLSRFALLRFSSMRGDGFGVPPHIACCVHERCG